MAKLEKVAAVERMKKVLPESEAAWVTDHTGLNVDEISSLRNDLRREGTEFHVVKNTLARLAANETGCQGLDKYLQGPTAIAFIKDDPVATAKLLVKFVKDHKKLVLKGGLLEGKQIEADGIRAVADLPTREVLLAQIAGSMLIPISMMAGALSAPVRSMAYALQAVQQKKSESAS